MGAGGHQENDTYVCSLPEEEKKRAFEELREDDNIREQSLQQVRDWIAKHPNIKKCRTGMSRKLTKKMFQNCPFNDINCAFTDQILSGIVLSNYRCTVLVKVPANQKVQCTASLRNAGAILDNQTTLPTMVQKLGSSGQRPGGYHRRWVPGALVGQGGWKTGWCCQFYKNKLVKFNFLNRFCSVALANLIHTSTLRLIWFGCTAWLLRL